MNWFKSIIKYAEITVAYHGSASEFELFNYHTGYMGTGVYLTSSIPEAKEYAHIAINMRKLKGGNATKRVYKVSFDITNPFKVFHKGTGYPNVDKTLKDKGYDSVICEFERGTIEYCIFDKSKIKILETIEF